MEKNLNHYKASRIMTGMNAAPDGPMPVYRLEGVQFESLLEKKR